MQGRACPRGVPRLQCCLEPWVPLFKSEEGSALFENRQLWGRNCLVLEMPPPKIAERLNKPQVAVGQDLWAELPGPEAKEREEERS